MIYHDPNDPERGYFTDDEVIPCPAGGFMVADEEDDVTFRVEPWTDCSICGRDVASDTHIPVCERCKSDLKREVAEHRARVEFPDPEARR